MYKECHIMNIGCTPYGYVDSGVDPRAQHVSISFGSVHPSEDSVLAAMASLRRGNPSGTS